MKKHCLTCQHEPTWQKFYDEIHDGICLKTNKTVVYGAATHGEKDEYCEVEDCPNWEEYDGKSELNGRKHREQIKANSLEFGNLYEA